MAKPKKTKGKYVSKGERRNVSKAITKDMKRHRQSTRAERVLDAYLNGKPVSKDTQHVLRHALGKFPMYGGEEKKPNEKAK